jgi:NADPH-dependent 2,4-dienoyl-CoA reductase/sulfur reductase-like enzyme
MQLLVIGGSDAGISAALRSRELANDVEATILVADDYPNFSICGLPFYVSGETPLTGSNSPTGRSTSWSNRARDCS